MKIALSFLITFSVINSEAKVMWKRVIEPAKKGESLKKEVKTKPSKRKNTITSSGNLPNYARVLGTKSYSVKDVSKITSDSYYINTKIKAGEEFKISLDDVIYAIEDNPTPITGVVLSGKLIGSRVIGSTYLEPQSKSILVKFNKLYTKDGVEYEIMANAYEGSNVTFKPTKYVSNKNRLLFSSVLSAFSSAYLNSKVRTQQSLLGSYQSTDTRSSTYAGARDGAEKVSDHFQNAFKNSKDFAYLVSKKVYTLKLLSSPKSVTK